MLISLYKTMPNQQTTVLILMQPKKIEQLIAANLKCTQLSVESSDNTHYQSLVVSHEFSGKSKIQRHRMIYSALGTHMHADIHALTMQLYTPEEYASLYE